MRADKGGPWWLPFTHEARVTITICASVRAAAFQCHDYHSTQKSWNYLLRSMHYVRVFIPSILAYTCPYTLCDTYPPGSQEVAGGGKHKRHGDFLLFSAPYIHTTELRLHPRQCMGCSYCPRNPKPDSNSAIHIPCSLSIDSTTLKDK